MHPKTHRTPKLADVLGLRIVVTVQKAARPIRRGPKLKQEKSMTKNRRNNSGDSGQYAAEAADATASFAWAD